MSGIITRAEVVQLRESLRHIAEETFDPDRYNPYRHGMADGLLVAAERVDQLLVTSYRDGGAS